MAFLKNIVFIGILLVVVANADFVTFDGSCPDLSLPDDLDIDFTAEYYTIAQTGNGTSESNIVNQLTNITSDSFFNVKLFRTPPSAEECEQVIIVSSYIKPRTYEIVYQDGPSTRAKGDYVYILPNTIVLVCRNLMDTEMYEAEVSVVTKDTNEKYDSDLQSSVKDVLKEYDLEYLNEYFSPIKQDNSCSPRYIE